jgi:poly(hydroxyalkanoate) depolymerase family esterase
MTKLSVLLFFLAISFFPQCPTDTSLIEINDFGDNPGKLKCFLYAPEGAPANAPLVVVLHGCVQDASEIARLSGWNQLADEHGFLVLYPQQQRGNNLNNCFNWFVPQDISRGSGEALSIQQMVAHVSSAYPVDRERVFVTGISAGGAMVAAMLAAYPEVFRAGAAMAAVPYGAAADMSAGFRAMRGEIVLDQAEWEARVREQNQGFPGSYPGLAIFHGTDDPIVSFVNAQELTKQWAALHDLQPEAPTEVETFEDNPRVRRSIFKDSIGQPVLLRYDFDSLGHAIAVDPGEGPLQGGMEGQFAKDIDFHSSYWAAEFFGLIGR